MSKPKISVAMATFNEEAKIDQALKSVTGWVDQIVVVDGESVDKTAEIAKKHKAKVVVTDNKPIFHINKQLAIDQCQGEWILLLDADEIITKELKKEILSLVKENDSLADAYYLPRKNFFLGKWLKKGGQYPDRVIRLFKKGKAYLPCQSVHEQMVVDGIVSWLKGHLLHYPYDTFSEYLVKSNRYTSLSAQERFNGKEKVGFCPLLKSYWQAEKTFWNLYLRHKGFLDGFPGFVFALFSGLHHITSYIKYWERKKGK